MHLLLVIHKLTLQPSDLILNAVRACVRACVHACDACVRARTCMVRICLEVSKHGVLGVVIYRRLVLDVLCTRRIPNVP